MAFDYDKVREKIEDDLTGHWASYSDLFMVMSTIFLMCYSVSKLYGTSSIQQQRAESQQLTKENEDLKEQIKVYSTLREDYLKTGANSDERKVYRELMNKLNLLQDEAKQEKEGLTLQAKEIERKEQALNKYQQLVRNIINANLVASARIKTRDQMLDQQEEALEEKQARIKSMRTRLQKMEAQIDEGNQKIRLAKNQLVEGKEKLQSLFKENHITKIKFTEMMKQLEQKSQAEVAKLKAINEEVAAQLGETSRSLSEAQLQVQNLDKQRKVLSQQTRVLASEKESLLNETQTLKGQTEELKGQAEALKGQTAALKGQTEALKGQTQALRSQAENLKSETETLKFQKAALSSQKNNLQANYDHVRQLANARKDLAERIKRNFAKAGIPAEVDPKTGDVTIGFGTEYFETDRSDLKPKMTNILRDTIPVYSGSLFEDPKIAEKITAVEIVGFASPTYKGKFVDPTSLSTGDRSAVNYNMDLSYRRARSIFDYIFDPAKMTYQNQERLLPLVKVTGRSYLAEKLERGMASQETSIAEYCQRYDCKKAQKVIIKFNLGE